MRKGRILITGSGGFVGGFLSGELVDKLGKDSVVLMTRNKMILNTDEEIRLKYLPSIDVLEYEELFKKYEISTVIHCAGIPKERLLPWKVYEEVNVEWPYKLLKALMHVEGEKFIFISSLGVYGTAPQYIPADESHPFAPDGKYHLSKALAEQRLISEVLDGRNVVNLYILRCNAVYGHGDHGVLEKIVCLYSKKLLLTRKDMLISFCSLGLLEEVVEKIIMENVGDLVLNVTEPPIRMMDLIQRLRDSSIEGNMLHFDLAWKFSWASFWIPVLYNKYALLFLDRIYSFERLEKFLGRKVYPLEYLDKCIGYYRGIARKCSRRR